MTTNTRTATVAVAGAGSIGVGFAVLFAVAAYHVRMWDAFPEALRRAEAEVSERLHLLSEHGLLTEPAGVVAARVSRHTELADAVREVDLLQECVPEDVALKQDLFIATAATAPADAVLASSSSALVPSAIADALAPPVAERLLVAHPGNPPYLLPVIELAPSPATSSAVAARASALYTGAGLEVVHVQREIDGLVFNRLQGAVLREAYCLVRDGVATVDDVDRVVRSGLGRRWSVIGPFETADLNTRGGVEAHARRLGAAYERMGAERGQHDPWTPDLVEAVTAQRRASLSLDQWEERVRWRDEQLMRHRPLWDAARPPS